MGALVCALFLPAISCGKRPGDDLQSSAKASPLEQQLVPLTNMIQLPAGSFVRQKHTITLSRPFWLAKFEVTQREFTAVMGRNPSFFPDKPDHPVEKVSFSDAVAYCAAITKQERESGRLPPRFEYRLPTEAEWEYACRAGLTNFFSFGDDSAHAGDYAWTSENSEDSTHPIGQKQPNPWGFHDIHGNVWEWCLDWFANYPDASLQDPSGPAEGKLKVFRGGSWYHELKFARSANRFMMAPANGINFVGFRIALGETAPRQGH